MAGVLGTAKDLARRLHIDTYLAYPLAIARRPYWWVRERYGPPVTIEVGDVEASFIATGPAVAAYHEFQSERNLVRDVLAEIRADDVFWDIGANMGLYSCLVGAKIDGGEVLAFEPAPVAELLERNLVLNQVSGGLRRVALSDVDGSGTLAVEADDSLDRQSTLARGRDTGFSKRPIPTRRAESLMAEGVSPPTVVKLDVEGAELAVLKGFGDGLNTVRTVYCELHPERLADLEATSEEVVAYLEEAGFELDRIDQRSDQPFVRARRRQSA